MKAKYKGEFSVAPYINQGFYYPNMSVTEIARCYNGIGAQWMDDRIRKILDKAFSVFRDAVLIHDVGYERGLNEIDKTIEDLQMLSNMRKCVWHEMSLFHPWKMKRFFGYAKLMYLAVKFGGDKAFWEGKVKK